MVPVVCGEEAAMMALLWFVMMSAFVGWRAAAHHLYRPSS